MRYKKLGTINKRKGLQMWEFNFNYGLLSDGDTEVFVASKSKREQQPVPEMKNPCKLYDKKLCDRTWFEIVRCGDCVK